MTKNNDSEDGYYKKTIDAYTQESGEEPALMINEGVVKSNAPYLYDLVQKNKRRRTLGMTRRVEYPKQGGMNFSSSI